jgi:hypothetical protein
LNYLGRFADDGRIEVDLGVYEERGHAAVAVDVFRLRWRQGRGDARLPTPSAVELNLPYELYAAHASVVLAALERPLAQLAVELKTEGLARRLHDQLTATTRDVPPAEAHIQQRQREPKVQPPHPPQQQQQQQQRQQQQQVEDVAAKRLRVEAAAPPAGLPAARPAPVEREARAPPQAAPQAAPQPLAARAEPPPPAAALLPAPEAAPGPPAPAHPAAGPDRSRVWIKGRAEFPPGSGRWPCLVKAGPLQHGYFTLCHEVCRAVLERGAHGPITLVLEDHPDQSWMVNYHVKLAAHRARGEVSRCGAHVSLQARRPERGARCLTGRPQWPE